MARRVISGLDYLPLDLNFMQDRKIRKLTRRCGSKAPLVYIVLLCAIYREGYYLNMDEDLSFDIAELLQMQEDEVCEVVDACVEIGLFCKKLYDEYKILTSVGIQRRYEYVCEKSRRKAHVTRYSLISSEDNRISSSKMSLNTEETVIDAKETPINSECIHTRKEVRKESKEGRKKEKDFFSEKERILNVLFFRNLQEPEREYEKLVAYNSGPLAKKKWAGMTLDDKVAMAQIWRQEPPRPPRFEPVFLDTWKNVVKHLPDLLQHDALSDRLRCEINGDRLVLTVSRALSEHIEENIQTFGPLLFKYMQHCGCQSMSYRILNQE